jgi:hypothetical protein
MEIQELVNRYAEALAGVDAETNAVRANQRTGEIYLPGLKTLSEAMAIDEVDKWWGRSHPDDFVTPDAHRTQVSFAGGTRNKCDHVLTTVGQEDTPEWAIEAKFLHLVGDNGKANDFAVAKALSPYLKDRSLYHDIMKLRANPIARRLAVIGFSFSYDSSTCDRALQLHGDQAQRVSEIRGVCERNGGQISIRPLVDFADGIFRVRELIVGQYVRAPFEAWRHPCGGKGVVFGWEIRRQGGNASDADW